MNTITPYRVSAHIFLSFRLLALAALSLTAYGTAHADDSSAPSTPSIGLVYQVYLPNGNPRIYEDAQGPTYWREGLAIAQGDQIQVQANVAAGTQPLVRFQARLDQASTVAATIAPWLITIDTKTLSVGPHTLDVQAQLGGGRTRLAKRSSSFVIVASLADARTDPAFGSGAISSVKGAAQVLSQGSVTSVPLPSEPVKPPALVASGTPDGNAATSLDFGAADNTAVRAGRPVVLDQTKTIRVSAPYASSAHRYVFSLARNGAVLYTSPTILDADSTRIQLQPKTSSQSGLLPGIVHLFVWGVDDAGNYGPASEATLDVRQPGQSSSSGQ